MREVLDKYGLRVVTSHRKFDDFLADLDEIILACEESGVRWALVEQDKNHVDGDPFKALNMSYDYLTTKGFN